MYMSTYRRKPAWVAFYDRVKIQQELEKMAEQGWIIERLGAFYWTYRRAEPKRRHVSVVYVADGSAFNAEPTQGEQLLEELCRQDGWVLTASWGQMQIYYNEQEDPTPMETDPVTQVETIHRAMKKNGIPATLANLGSSLLWIGAILWNAYVRPAETLSGIWIWLVLDELVQMLAAIIDLICGRLWYRKAMRAAEQGTYLEIWNHRVLTWILTTLSFLVLGMMLLSLTKLWSVLVLAAVAVALVIWLSGKIQEGMKSAGCSKRANLGVSIAAALVLTLVTIAGVSFIAIHFHLMDESKPVGTYEKYGRTRDVYADALPLRLEDLMDTGELEWSLEKQGQSSFLVSWYCYRQWPLTEDSEVMDFHYTVTDVPYPALYTHCKRRILQEKQDITDHGEVLHVEHYEPVDPAPWGAEEVYQLRWGDGRLEDYVLCYQGRLVELDLTWTPSAEQKQIVGEKLKP